MKHIVVLVLSLFALASCTQAVSGPDVQKSRTYLLETQEQVDSMRSQLLNNGRFSEAFLAQKALIDAKLTQEINVPLPKDAGGGYTHEVHKKNYADMYNAGRLYVLTQEQKYADYVTRILMEYANMYPTLPLHPKQKEQSPGKLFWQSLNEAVWLVYTSQAYDAVKHAVSEKDQAFIKTNLFEPMVDYLSEQSPQTFNKIHNHGTWATAAVGMIGYVLNNQEWVEKALYGLDRNGDAGFMKQLDMLFSPQGYYNEGPYYQRYALMPFVLFAQAVETNQPERKIFEYRDEILLKAINTTIQLSYNGLFFGINDAIKDKGIDTSELVHGVAIAYNKTGEKGLLTIADKQQQTLLTGYGLQVANDLDKGMATPYPFASINFGDGVNGDEGSLVVFRQNQLEDHQTLVFKATSQGLGHGHFDKLHWMFYNKGEEIVYDYGAARFLNIEAKYGGHYLPENKSYAKQTIAHNTLVVDEISHFKGNTKTGNRFHPEVLFVETDEEIQVASAKIDEAYDDVNFTRTQAMINTKEGKVFVLDILDVASESSHQYDLPVHFIGQFIDSTVTLEANTLEQKPLGDKNGYEHLWLQAKGKVEQPLAKVTWLKDKTFYTHATVQSTNHELLMTRIGANDPNFNLIANQALINRVSDASNHQFLSLLEVHGEYNARQEFTIASHSQLATLKNVSSAASNGVALYEVTFKTGEAYLIAIAQDAQSENASKTFTFNDSEYTIVGQVELIRI